MVCKNYLYALYFIIKPNDFVLRHKYLARKDKMNNKKNKQNKTSVIRNNLYYLRLIWKINPLSILIHVIVNILEYGVWVFYSVVFMQYLFGNENKLRSLEETITFVLLALIGHILFRTFYNWYWTIYNSKSYIRLRYGINTKLFEKVQSVDISCFENVEFYNTYTKAATEASDRAQSVIENCSKVICSFIASIYVVVTMTIITPWSLLFVTLPLFANLYLGKKIGKISFKENSETTEAIRRVNYVDRLIYFKKYAGELRLTNIYNVLEEMFKKATGDIVRIKRKYTPKYSFVNAIKLFLTYVLGYEGMWFCTAVLSLNEIITISQAIVLINAINSVSWMINDFEKGAFEMSKNAFFITNLQDFLNFTPKIDENRYGLEVPEKVETIEFKNVSFKYSGQKKMALENVNLIMQKGIHYALVGINGSGKSTLIKLIMRFYDPVDGEILLNGINIKEFNINKYRDLIGVAFQDFALFSSTVGENVLLRELQNELDRKIVINALKDSDIYDKVATLEKGIDTILTKEFDNNGIELSGGEKQKIAIARAFVKNSPIVILDEPSSALDPIAEYKMFQTIKHLCDGKNKLSIIVSHRLSSAAMCDKLFVFEKGVLKEEGTHTELLRNNGIYADMFLKQARSYTAGEVCSI